MPRRPPEYWADVLVDSVEYWQREHDSKRLYDIQHDVDLILKALRGLGCSLSMAYEDIELDRSLGAEELMLKGWAKAVQDVKPETCHWHPRTLWRAFDQTLRGLRAAALELSTGQEQAN